MPYPYGGKRDKYKWMLIRLYCRRRVCCRRTLSIHQRLKLNPPSSPGYRNLLPRIAAGLPRQRAILTSIIVRSASGETINIMTLGGLATISDFGRRRSVSGQAKPRTTKPRQIIVRLFLTGCQQVEDNLAALRVLEQEAEVESTAVTAAQAIPDTSMTLFRGVSPAI